MRKNTCGNQSSFLFLMFAAVLLLSRAACAQQTTAFAYQSGVDAGRQPATFDSSFIKNDTTRQTGNFNISGSGVIGDSLGVGVAAPRAGIKLDVVGNALISPGNGGAMQFGTPNSETGMSNIVGTGRADLRFDGATLKLVAGFVGGPPPSTNGIMISTAGNVGIGAAFPSPLFKLSVVGNGAVTGGLTIGNGTPVTSGLTVGSGNVLISNRARIENGLTVFNGASLGGNVSVNGGNLAVSGRIFFNDLFLGGDQSICRNSATGAIASCSSSLRYKTNIKSFGESFNFINQLRPIYFDWKQTGQPDVGFGAEDVAKINPLFVTYNSAGEVEGVKYDRLSVVFVNAFKEQQAQIEQQQIQIENLKKLICLDHRNADVCRGE